MLQQSPEHRKRLAESADSEAKAIKYEHARLKRHRLAFGAAAFTLLAGIHVSSYAADVRANQEIQADASIDVSTVTQALHPENNHVGIVFTDGFNTIDSRNLTEHIGPAIREVVDGQLLSVNYNNAILNKEDIAKKIIEKTKTDNIDELYLVGYSAGGSIMMDVQSYLEKDDDLTIKADFLASVPDGAKGLRHARQDEINMLEEIKYIPGAQYSTVVRFMGEMAFRSGSYTAPLDGDSVGANIRIFSQNMKHFFTTAGDVNHTIHDKTIPATWLMFDQALAIENGNMESHTKELSDMPDTKVRPTIVYLGTATPGYDYMVDNVKSGNDIQSYADAANIPSFIYNVPGAVHSRPDIAVDQYKKVLAAAKDEITQSIETQTEIADANQAYAEAQRYLPGFMKVDADTDANRPTTPPYALPKNPTAAK